jgi:hypothetical protein
VTRPRAADDFAAIRARMEELRREHAVAPPNDAEREVNRTSPDAVIGSVPATHGRSSGMSPMMRRAMDKVKTG